MANAKMVIGAASAVSMLVSVAQAADMPPRFELPTPPPIYRAPAADDGSGWYLRGDIGYRLNRLDSVSAATGFADPVNNSIGNGMAYGGGVGYKAGWIRADITGDYAPPVGFTGTVVTPGDVNGSVSAITALFNLYFDLGTWSGFTPYVGAGLGGANLRTSNYVSLVAPPLGLVSENSRWNLAWAATAGVSFGFTRNLMLDAGYRYLNMGDATFGPDTLGRNMTGRGLAAHEFRVGVRWMFGSLMQ